jgi:hypothetical protein
MVAFTKKIIYVCLNCGTENNENRTECKECGKGWRRCPTCENYLKISDPDGRCQECVDFEIGPENLTLEGKAFSS